MKNQNNFFHHFLFIISFTESKSQSKIKIEELGPIISCVCSNWYIWENIMYTWTFHQKCFWLTLVRTPPLIWKYILLLDWLPRASVRTHINMCATILCCMHYYKRLLNSDDNSGLFSKNLYSRPNTDNFFNFFTNNRPNTDHFISRKYRPKF